MRITTEMVDYISQLSRLSLPEEEKEAMTAQLERIVDYMDVLNQLDTADIEPMSHVFPVKNVLREDVVEPSFDRADAAGQRAGARRGGVPDAQERGVRGGTEMEL